MSKKMTIILIGICSLSLLFTGITFIVMVNKISKIEETFIEEDLEEEGDEGAREPGIMHPLGSFIVNLKDDEGSRYARVNIDVDLENEEMVAEIEKRKSQIRDMILMIISSKTAEDIRSVEGKQALRQEILEALRRVFKDGGVHGLFFTEFVIQ